MRAVATFLRVVSWSAVALMIAVSCEYLQERSRRWASMWITFAGKIVRIKKQHARVLELAEVKGLLGHIGLCFETKAFIKTIQEMLREDTARDSTEEILLFRKRRRRIGRATRRDKSKVLHGRWDGVLYATLFTEAAPPKCLIWGGAGADNEVLEELLKEMLSIAKRHVGGKELATVALIPEIDAGRPSNQGWHDWVMGKAGAVALGTVSAPIQGGVNGLVARVVNVEIDGAAKMVRLEDDVAADFACAVLFWFMPYGTTATLKLGDLAQRAKDVKWTSLVAASSSS